MKKTLFLAALLLAAVQALAGNVDIKTAQSKASDFLSRKAVNGRLMSSTPVVKWVHEEKNSDNAAMTAYYVVNTDKGFVVVAGDDRAKDILAYGETLKDMNNLPENMKFWLGC